MSTGDVELVDAVRRALASEPTDASMKHQIQVQGVIYLHDIRDTNVKECVPRNQSLFKKLLGSESNDHVMIVTTLWDQLLMTEQGTCVEAELEAAYMQSTPPTAVSLRRIRDSNNDESIYVSIIRELMAVATISGGIGSDQFAKLSLQDLVAIIASKDRELGEMRAELQAAADMHKTRLDEVVAEKVKLLEEVDVARKTAASEADRLQGELDRYKTEKYAEMSALQQRFDDFRRASSLDLARQPADGDGVTPLHRAARQGQTDLVKGLLGAGVSLEARMHRIDGSTDRTRGTPLHWAAIEGHHDVVAALLDAGAQIDARNAWRRTPLHCAARFGHLEVVKLLVERGAEKEARRDTNETPLHFAVEENRYNVVEFLVDAGVDVNAWGDRGTPLQFAYTKGHYQVAQLLASRGGRT